MWGRRRARSAPRLAGALPTLGEEIANSITHGVGLAASLVALPIVIMSAQRRDRLAVVGAAVFGGSLVILYAASTLYHALPPSRAKRVFRVLDHTAIYLLIAGSYTPFALGALRGPWGWSLLGAVWGLAAIGITLKATRGLGREWLSTALYLLMGWLSIIAVRPLVTHVGAAGLAWLAAGGLFYTAGVVFFVIDTRLRYAHMVWHLFVAAGSLCHFFAVLWYSAGTRRA
ncbi:MAG: hemolysin III family protein [Gemmatimonadaceae bacterium]